MAKRSSSERKQEQCLNIEDLKDVQEELFYVSGKWYDIGVQLSMKPGLLNVIRYQYSNPVDCLREMLTQFLEGTNPIPTWNSIAHALESRTVNERKLAKTVRETFLVSVPTTQPSTPPHPTPSTPPLPYKLHRDPTPSQPHVMTDPAYGHSAPTPSQPHVMTDPAYGHRAPTPAQPHLITDPAYLHRDPTPAQPHVMTDPAYGHGAPTPSQPHAMTDPGYGHGAPTPSRPHVMTDPAYGLRAPTTPQPHPAYGHGAPTPSRPHKMTDPAYGHRAPTPLQPHVITHPAHSHGAPTPPQPHVMTDPAYGHRPPTPSQPHAMTDPAYGHGAPTPSQPHVMSDPAYGHSSPTPSQPHVMTDPAYGHRSPTPSQPHLMTDPAYGHRAPTPAQSHVMTDPAYLQRAPIPSQPHVRTDLAYGHRSPTPSQPHLMTDPAYGHRAPTPAQSHVMTDPAYLQRAPIPSQPHVMTDPAYGHRAPTPPQPHVMTDPAYLQRAPIPSQPHVMTDPAYGHRAPTPPQPHVMTDPAYGHRPPTPSQPHAMTDPAYGHGAPTPSQPHVMSDPAYGHSSPTPSQPHVMTDPAYGHRSPTPSQPHLMTDPAYGHRAPTPAQSHVMTDPAYLQRAPIPSQPHVRTDLAYGHRSPTPSQPHLMTDPAYGHRAPTPAQSHVMTDPAYLHRAPIPSQPHVMTDPAYGHRSPTPSQPHLMTDPAYGHRAPTPAQSHVMTDPAYLHRAPIPSQPHVMTYPAMHGHGAPTPSQPHVMTGPAYGHRSPTLSQPHVMTDPAYGHRSPTPSQPHLMTDPAYSHRPFTPSQPHVMTDPAYDHGAPTSSQPHAMTDPVHGLGAPTSSQPHVVTDPPYIHRSPTPSQPHVITVPPYHLHTYIHPPTEYLPRAPTLTHPIQLHLYDVTYIPTAPTAMVSDPPQLSGIHIPSFPTHLYELTAPSHHPHMEMAMNPAPYPPHSVFSEPPYPHSLYRHSATTPPLIRPMPRTATSTQAPGPVDPDPVGHLLTQRPPPKAPHTPYKPTPQMHPVDQYAKYLRAYYEGEKLPVYSKWPPTSSKKYIHLAVVKKKQVSRREADEFTRATLHGNIDDIIWKKGPLDFSRVGLNEDGSHARSILVEGAPGIGKTTFAWMLGRKWSKCKILQWCRLVVLLRLRDKRVREAKTVYDLLYYSDDEVRRDVAKEVIRNNGESVLLLFEGFDELHRKLQTQESIFLDILNRKKLPKATVLITSRPSATQFLQSKRKIDQHIEILGFTTGDIQSYIQSVIKDQQLHTEFTQYLKCHPHIRGLMYVPLNAVIVTQIYKTAKLNESQDFVPTTLTELYSSLTRGMLLRYLKSHSEHGKQEWKLSRFSDLPEELYKQFHTICGVAFQGIFRDEVIFDHLASDFNTLDLMQSAPELYVDQGVVISHNFFHLTLQEFLAAVHVSRQPPEEQLQYFAETCKEPEMKLLPQEQHSLIQEMQPSTSTLEPLTSALSKPPTILAQQEEVEPQLQLANEVVQVENTEPYTCERLQSPKQQWIERHPLQGLMAEQEFTTEPPSCTSEPPTFPAPYVSKPNLMATSTLPSRRVLVPEQQQTERKPLPLQEIPQLLQTTAPFLAQDQGRLGPLQVPLMTKPQSDIQHTEPVSSPAGSNAPLISSHFHNVLKFTAGLTKFKGLPVASMKSIILQDQGGNQEIPLYSLHWLFEAQCISMYNNLIRETATLTFDYKRRSMHPFDFFVLGFALSHINCKWNIDLWWSLIGDEGLEMFVAGMHYSEATLPPSLKSVSLILGRCDISSVGLSHLKEMPKVVATRITELDFYGNEGIIDGVTSLISNLKSLKTLKLGLTSLSPQEVEQLAELLSHSQLYNLEYLGLNRSLKSPESTNHILRALPHNTTLREIYLFGARVSENNLSLLTSTLTTNTTLRKVVLGRCGINDDMVIEIMSALCDNSTLETLDLALNTIHLRGATAIAEMLRRNQTLRELDVWGNSIGEEGTLKLTSSLEHNSTLEKLNFGYNAIGLRGSTALAEMLGRNKTLRDLDVSRNFIGEEGTLKLASSLEHNSTLETLNLRSNDIGPSGATALAEMLRRNATLRELDVSYNSIKAEGALKLVSSLEKNATPEKLAIDDKYRESLPRELHLKAKRRLTFY